MTDNQAESGYGQTPDDQSGYQGSGYNPSGYQVPGYQVPGYQAPGYAADPNYYSESAAVALGAVGNPLLTQRIENPFAENVYEANPFDSALTESFTNPNPQGPGFSGGDYTPSYSRDDDQQIQLEM